MSEQLKPNNTLPLASDGQDVVAWLKKIHSQLVALEGKLDVLINKPSERPSSERPSSDRPFSKPFRSFGRSHYHNDSTASPAGSAGGEKRFERKDSFRKSYSGASRGFGFKSKSYGSSRESSSGPERSFSRRAEGKKEGFDPKKKAFSFRRKERG